MNIVKLKKVDSTNKYAFKLLNKYSEVIVVSKEQSGGYGRDKSTWESPEGNIYLSLGKIIKVSNLYGLSVKTGVFLVEFFREYSNCEFYIKWPNDIYLGDRKLCGILIESRVKENKAKVVLGIGINFEKAPLKNSARLIDCVDVGREEFEANLIEKIQGLFDFDNSLIYSKLINYSYLKKGDLIEFYDGFKNIKGVFLGYTKSFQILVEVKGEILKFSSGQVKKIRKS